MRYYQIHKKNITMICLVIVDQQCLDSVVLVLQMLIAYFKNFFVIQNLTIPTMKHFLMNIWVKRIIIKVIILDHFLIMIFLIPKIIKWAVLGFSSMEINRSWRELGMGYPNRLIQLPRWLMAKRSRHRKQRYLMKMVLNRSHSRHFKMIIQQMQKLIQLLPQNLIQVWQKTMQVQQKKLLNIHDC
jgi:hypothetical protein